MFIRTNLAIACLLCIQQICAEDLNNRVVEPVEKATNVVRAYDSNQLSVCVYNGSISFVTDVRKVQLKRGKNVVYVYNISPKLDIKSVDLNCSKCVLSYELLKRSSSYSGIFKSSVGNNISFKSGNDKITGVLKSVFNDKELNKKFAIVNRENETYIVPVEDCMSVFSTNISTKKDAIKISIVSEADADAELTLSYITRDISWQPEYSIRINNQMTNADIDIKGSLVNNTDWDMNNVDLTFDYSTPELDKLADHNIESKATFAYPSKLSLKHYSSAVIPINTINHAKLNHDYYIKISDRVAGNQPLVVHNLLSCESSVLNDYLRPNSNALLYLVNGRHKKVLGQQGTKSIDGLKEVAFLVGTTNDVTASIRYVDTRNITDKMSEISVAIEVKNNKPIDVNAYVSADVSGDYTLLKESDNRVNQKSLLWNILVPANSTKELYYKVRINKK